MKHLPFHSNYREKFEVVEQVQGGIHLFPHTEQLPVLLRALNLEFYNPLPGYIARVDQRGKGFQKCLLQKAALMFCAGINASRQDELRLYALLDPALVARLTIVQQLTRHTPRGALHGFRFYGGADFFPEIYLSGKRLWFTDHVLQRFSTRVPNNVGEDLSWFLLAFYGASSLSMRVGHGRAFLVPFRDSVLAFTYTEDDEEFVITTCLTVNEMSSLSLEVPALAFNLHYGQAFTQPSSRNWFPDPEAADLYQRWKRKVPLARPVSLPKTKAFHWPALACRTKDRALVQGIGPGSDLRFQDDIPGPVNLLLPPAPSTGAQKPPGAHRPAASHSMNRLEIELPVRRELGQAMLKFVEKLKTCWFGDNPDAVMRRAATEEYRLAVDQAARRNIESWLAWHTLAVWTEDSKERISYFARALDCSRADTAANPPKTPRGTWSLVHTQADCLFEIGRVHFHEGAPEAARRFLSDALPLARQAETLRTAAGVGDDRLEGRIAELLQRLPKEAQA